MKDLIERLEKATEAARGLDAEIALAVGPWTERHGLPSGGWVSVGPHHAVVAAPLYTASIDAALTLVPEGAQWSVCSHENGRFYVECGGDGWQYEGPTAAIALCVGALNARVAYSPEIGKT